MQDAVSARVFCSLSARRQTCTASAGTVLSSDETRFEVHYDTQERPLSAWAARGEGCSDQTRGEPLAEPAIESSPSGFCPFDILGRTPS